MNGLVRFSSPMVVGIVGASLARRASTSLHPGLKIGVAGLHRQREAAIAERVFVAAIDACLVGQRHQLLHRRPHHRGRALEQPPAAHREQCVPGEGGIAVGEDEGDMRPRMGRNFQDLRPVRPELPGRALVHAHIDARDAVAVLAGAHDFGPERLLEGEVPARVVEVMVGVEDVGQLRAACGEPRPHGLRLGRVHDRAQPLGFVPHQIGVVVAQAGDQLDG